MPISIAITALPPSLCEVCSLVGHGFLPLPPFLFWTLDSPLSPASVRHLFSLAISHPQQLLSLSFLWSSAQSTEQRPKHPSVPLLLLLLLLLLLPSKQDHRFWSGP